MLYAGIIAVVVIIVIAAAAVAYLYMDDQARQNKNREALKQAFSDQLNATGEVYAKVTEYQAAPDKNYVEDFRVWIDGYLQRADNYTLAEAGSRPPGQSIKPCLAAMILNMPT